MEPENRPYVDAATTPGDIGTENWSNGPDSSRPPAQRPPRDEPAGTSIDNGVTDGSPADEFINNPDVIALRKHGDDRA